MKTLQDIKNQYAQEQGYEDWEEYFMSHFATSSFSMTATLTVFEKIMNEICIRAQKAALEKAAENAAMNLDFQLDWHSINKESITNPENLIQ